MKMTGHRKAISIAVLIIGISTWHYVTEVHQPFLHILHRELYLIPIGLAAYWFGTRGGVLTGVISILIFLPKVLMGGHGQSTYYLNNLLAIPTFLLLGYFVGKYQDVRKNQFTTLWTNREQPAEPSEKRNILLCIDNSQHAYKAARYVADHFTASNHTEVTVMGFIRDPSQEFFPDSEAHAKARTEIEGNISSLVASAKEALLDSGFPPDAVHTQILRLQKESIAVRILEEQKKGGYSTIVAGGTKMNKTEEFILGNKAVKLVREADCPVITVF